jgi:hypothetical protein
MRKSAFFLCVLTLLFAQSALWAQTSGASTKEVWADLPHVIISGMEAYRDKGPDEAVRVWIKGSPLEGSKDALSQANNLRRVQDFYGLYRGFELVGTRTLSSRTRIFYVILNFESGPLFSKFVVYRSEEGWILTSFDFNTKDESVFPTEIGFPAR